METTGGFLEYYVELEYIGKRQCGILERTIGYNGKRYDVANGDIVLGNKKIKDGTRYYTIYYPLNGGR